MKCIICIKNDKKALCYVCDSETCETTNQKVVGSNPSGHATKSPIKPRGLGLFYFSDFLLCANGIFLPVNSASIVPTAAVTDGLCG